MIPKLLSAVALAAALCAGGAAQAAVVTFNDPGVVEIDNDTNVATYTEAGFTISGQAASFLLNGDAPGPQVLLGGSDPTPFSLMQVGGGLFSLFSLAFGAFDDGVAGTLTIRGSLSGGGTLSEMVSFSSSSSTNLMFGAEWAQLSEVSFSGTALFSLDNINAAAVPEPGTLALSSLALLGLGLRRRQQAQRAA